MLEGLCMKKMEGFSHGINLGGWLSQCKYDKNHFDTFIQEKDFEVIKSWNLDHVRVPVDYNLVQNADGSFREDGFIYIDNAIKWCKKNNLNMILDLHKTLGYSFYEGENENGFFENEKYQNYFYSLWEEFSTRYSENKDMLCFELLNEVTSESYCKTWNEIAKKCIEKIRKISPTIRILVGSYWNNSVETVKYLDAPYDENIIYNFHCYEPLIFTHQGAYWISKMNRDFRMPLNTKFADYVRFTKENVSQDGDVFKGCNPDECPDVSYFERLFEDALKVARERNVCLYCGEYGVINKADPKEALKWYRLISKVFNKYDIGRAAWSYKEMDFDLSGSWLKEERDEILKCL